MKRDRQGVAKQGQQWPSSPTSPSSAAPGPSSTTVASAPADSEPAGDLHGKSPSSPQPPRSGPGKDATSPRRGLPRSPGESTSLRLKGRESPKRARSGGQGDIGGGGGQFTPASAEVLAMPSGGNSTILASEARQNPIMDAGINDSIMPSEGDLSFGSSQGDASDSMTQPFTLTSTISRGTYHQCGSARRVKVYELKGEIWEARGTGYCAGVYDEQLDEALLVARMEEKCHMMSGVAIAPDENAIMASSTPHSAEAHINSSPGALTVAAEGEQSQIQYVIIVSETLDTDDVMLKSKVVRDDVYQRQQDTLVVWTEPDGVDLALSFQEAEGCHEVWEFLTEVQKHFMISENPLSDSPPTTPNPHSPLAGMGAFSSSVMDSESLGHGGDNMFALPQPQFSNLDLVELHLKEIASRSPTARERVAEWLLKEEYIKQLIPLFQDAEELEALASLHSLCSIMQTILLLNDNVIFEYILLDDIFFGVVGMLEYDPEFPRLKANYREYLEDNSRFRQVIPIEEPNILTKIHQTYRLLYLKDVILARVLDDPTFSILNSFVFFHQVDIVNYFTTNEPYLVRLFQIFDSNANEAEERMHEAVIFLQQLCAMGKQVQLPPRVQLYRTLVKFGLLNVVEYALARPEDRLRNAASEIFMTIIEYDADSVRNHVMDQVDQKKRPLVTMLADLLHTESDLGLKTQLAEAMRVIFDIGPEGLGGPAVATAQALVAATGQQRSVTDPDKFLTWFYEGNVEHLFGPLSELPNFQELEQSGRRLGDFTRARSALYSHLCELLCYMVAHHTFRSHYFVLTSELSLRVASLLYSREKHIRLAALRFFRTCVAGNNQFTHRHFIKVDLFGAILKLLEREVWRDNLVTSACLDFFEAMRRDNLKQILTHLVERHSSQVRALADNPLASKTFGGILSLTQKNSEPSFSTDSAGGMTAVQAAENARIARDVGRRGIAMIDADEENYFNEDDEDDVDKALGNDDPAKGGILAAKSGALPVSGPLASIAQYGDNDDGEDFDAAATSMNAVAIPLSQSQLSADAPTAPIAEQVPRLSEKRRRGKDEEEDDGDIMGRIAKRKERSAIAESDAEDERLGAGGFMRVLDGTTSPRPTGAGPRTGSGSAGQEGSGSDGGVQKISISLSSFAKRMAGASTNGDTTLSTKAESNSQNVSSTAASGVP